MHLSAFIKLYGSDSSAFVKTNPHVSNRCIHRLDPTNDQFPSNQRNIDRMSHNPPSYYSNDNDCNVQATTDNLMKHILLISDRLTPSISQTEVKPFQLKTKILSKLQF